MFAVGHAKNRPDGCESGRGKTFYPPQQGMLRLVVEPSECNGLLVDWDGSFSPSRSRDC